MSDPKAQRASAHDRLSSALWYEAKGKLTIRTETLQARNDRESSLHALWTGVSRGTEKLVFTGMVPPGEAARMRCPYQYGDFPFPVRYGYGFVGEIVESSAFAPGTLAFCLHPHASHAVVADVDVHPLPKDVPPRRAVLTANMETALNVVWDARISAGDRVVVAGAGVVGLLIAWLASRFPGTSVVIADPDAARRRLAVALSLAAVDPAELEGSFDVAVNASASDAALDGLIAVAGLEGRIVEASWYGDRPATIRLGGGFHSQRLTIVSSQVGRIPADRQARWSFARRLRMALELLKHAPLDALITHEIAFLQAPAALPPLFDDPNALGIALRYDEAEMRG
ncbi:MAG: zinc-binding alcohol dehydrogenase [Pseudomonadota bacterium]